MQSPLQIQLKQTCFLCQWQGETSLLCIVSQQLQESHPSPNGPKKKGIRVGEKLWTSLHNDNGSLGSKTPQVLQKWYFGERAIEWIENVESPL